MIDTLYIIGNGFDLHHGLRTSYLNFRDDYVKEKSSVLWHDFLDIYGDAPQKDNLWWKDFENMLGRVDYVNLAKSRNGEVMGASKVRSLMNGKLPPLFGEWIEGVDNRIDLNNIKMMQEINAKALFFTFNYTMLLEKAYHVNNERIWHIHGSIKAPDDIVVGHDADAGQLVKYTHVYNKSQQSNFSSYANQVNQEVLNGAKKVKDRIYFNELNNRFNQYVDIRHFVAMGFSFNDIDMPYIEKIWSINEHKKDMKWTLYVHTPEDESIIGKLTAMGVNKIQTKNW